MQAHNSLTSEEYWSQVWENTSFKPINPDHHYNRELIRAFTELAKLLAQPSIKFIEAGCGNSVWLPYLANAFGWSVSGFDYSEIGCRLARKNLAEAGVSGEIRQRDLFADNSDLYSQYDIVYSGGLIEHFEDPVSVIHLMAEFLRPGGIMVTTIPNLYNLTTIIQRIVGPRTLALHNFINLAELCRYHEDAGLVKIRANYIGFGGIIVPDENPTARSSAGQQSLLWRRLIRAGFRPLFFLASRSVRLVRHTFDSVGIKMPQSEKLSPVAIYVGQKPTSV